MTCKVTPCIKPLPHSSHCAASGSWTSRLLHIRLRKLFSKSRLQKTRFPRNKLLLDRGHRRRWRRRRGDRLLRRNVARRLRLLVDVEEAFLEGRPVRDPAQEVQQFGACNVIRIPEFFAELVHAPDHDDPPVQRTTHVRLCSSARYVAQSAYVRVRPIPAPGSAAIILRSYLMDKI